MTNTQKMPNPDRIYSTVAAILERRYNVKIQYDLIRKESEV